MLIHSVTTSLPSLDSAVIVTNLIYMQHSQQMSMQLPRWILQLDRATDLRYDTNEMEAWWLHLSLLLIAVVAEHCQVALKAELEMTSIVSFFFQIIDSHSGKYSRGN